MTATAKRTSLMIEATRPIIDAADGCTIHIVPAGMRGHIIGATAGKKLLVAFEGSAWGDIGAAMGSDDPDLGAHRWDEPIEFEVDPAAVRFLAFDEVADDAT